MGSTRAMAYSLVALGVLTLLPSVTFAQTTGTIAGMVKDTTGAVLPGVTVEAASPALIEKVRSVVADDRGQYKIVDLRPGVYTVTFALAGFNTVKREGIALSAAFTANVSVELAVGNVTETITVSGASPLVDVQNVTQQRVVTREILDSLPTSRTFQSVSVLTPGVVSTAQDVGGLGLGPTNTYMTIHGSRGVDMPLLIDGLRFNNMNSFGGGFQTNYETNPANIQEITVETAGTSAEFEISGVTANVVPKEGGNRFNGSFFTNFSNQSLQGSNITDALRARGLVSVTSLVKMWDINPAVGGPIKNDKLWFFAAFRHWGSIQQPPGVFYATNPLAFVYTPALSRPGQTDGRQTSMNVRLTWQASPKHKFGVFFDHVDGLLKGRNLSATVTPEAAANRIGALKVGHATWKMTVTNRLLLDAAEAVYTQDVDYPPMVSDPPPTYSVLELRTGIKFRGPTDPGGIGDAGGYQRDRTHSGRASLTYVTGSHAFKTGTQWQFGHNYEYHVAYNDTDLILLDGVPNSVQVFTTPLGFRRDLKADISLFARDQWTLKRITLNGGLRFTYLNALVPEHHLPPVQFVGARDFAAIPNVPNWKTLTPRLGVAWDVAGDGKTAIKASLGEYVLGMTTAIAREANPVIASVNTTTRPWSDTNGDFIPQSSELGPLANANFGKTAITTRWDPDATEGWGKRGYNWEGSVALQHEFRTGLAVNAAYFRHWVGNFYATDNLAVSPSDYNSYCITAPTDTRLPGGGGNQICGLYDINPSKFGQFNNLVVSAKRFGDQSEVYNGVDFSFNLRLGAGVVVQGGTSTGHTVTDNCDLVGKVENPASGGSFASINLSGVASPSTLYCHIAPPFQTQSKVLAIYPLPWWGLQAGATFQSLPGPSVLASFVATNAQIAPSLGRNLAGGVTTAAIPLIAPGSQFGDRLNQVDLRLAKNFKVRATRIQGQFDLFNLLNANPVLGLNTRYGPAWLTPTRVLSGRLLKFGVQVDF